MRLPNAHPGHPRLTLNHLRRLNNSQNRQGALYGKTMNLSSVRAIQREINLRQAIANEVGMPMRNINPYVHKYQNLMKARANNLVHRAASGFKNTRRTHAMIGQLASASVNAGGRTQGIPPEIRRMIALAMRKNALQRRN